jgi:integrase
VPHRERAWLDSAGVRALLDATRPAKPRRGRKPPLPPGGRLHALWALAATAGLRMGEALALSWDDLDLDAATVRVSRTLHREGGEWVTMEPKTRGSRRLVPLTPLAVEALRGHRLRQAEERLAAGSPGRGGLVFATRSGAPLHGSNVLAALYRAEDAAGLGRVPFHGLRHAAASVMLEAGVPMRVVSELLGHSTIRITSDLYSHVAPAVSRDAAERVQRALS